jgi:hypothetical protein
LQAFCIRKAIVYRGETSMAAELKTDAWHRYMLYRSSERYMTFEPEEKRKEAVDAGKRFTASAYADVWAKDAELVKRVRVFLRENFHWHDRLATSGGDLSVVQTLMDMVRGGSVVVIPEKPILSGGIAWPSKKPASSSFWGVEDYDPPRYASVKERYLAQIAELQANETPWSVIEAMNDSINQKFMHAAVLIDPLGMLPTFARAGWISKYGLPDLSRWGQEADADADSNTPDLSIFSDSDEVDVRTPLGDAQPFELGESTVSDDVREMAARGVSEGHEAECLSEYEFELEQCNFIGAMYNDPRTYALCRQNAFSNYQSCRGY